MDFLKEKIFFEKLHSFKAETKTDEEGEEKAMGERSWGKY